MLCDESENEPDDSTKDKKPKKINKSKKTTKKNIKVEKNDSFSD